MAARDSLHQRRQAPGQLGRGRVALFLGQPDEAGQVHKADTRRGLEALVQALGLEDALEVANGMVEPDMLAVPPVERHQGLLQQRDQVHAGGAALVEQILLGRSGLTLWLLDLGLVEFGLGLGQPAQGIGIGAQQPQYRSLLGPDRHELLDQLDDHQVVLTNVVGGGWWAEAEGVVQLLHHGQVDAALGAELLVGARSRGWAPIVGASMNENGNSPRVIRSPIVSTESPAASQALRNRSRAASPAPNPAGGLRCWSAPAWMARSTKAGSASASRASSAADNWTGSTSPLSS
jgi:hypothetical protein